MPGFGPMIDRFAYAAMDAAGGLDRGMSRLGKTRGYGMTRGIGRFARDHPYVAGGGALGGMGAYRYASSGRVGLRGRASGSSYPGMM